MRQGTGPEVRFVAEHVEAPLVWVPLTDRAAALPPFSRLETPVEAVARAALALDRPNLTMTDPGYEFARAFLDVIASVVPVTSGIVVMPLSGEREPLVVASVGNDVVTVSPDLAAASIRDRSAALVSPVSSATRPDVSDGRPVFYAPLSDPDVRMPLACVLVTAPGFGAADLTMAAAFAGIARSRYATREVFFRLARELDEMWHPSALVDSCDRAWGLSKAVQQASQTTRPALVSGEPGTGTAAVARMVHALSARSDGPFMTEDCAIPETVVEASLWGFERGTFTGGSPVGLLERAHGGTLYLRRIERMSLDAQAKLVTFIDTGVVRRLGALWSTRSNVRVVASTSADLVELVNRGAFLHALCARFTSIPIRIRPLRDRAADIPSLADCYVRVRGRATPAASPPVSAAAVQCLTAYDWPGNDRELGLVIERAALHAAGHTILPEHLPDLAAEMHARHARLGLARE